MMYCVYRTPYNSELYHHGIQGMKWGVRRYQNEDGSLTEEGKRRYNTYSEKAERAEGRLKAANAEIDRAREAKQKYKDAKNDEFMRKSGEAKRLKKEAKKLNSKRNSERMMLEKRQAEWEKAKYQKKADKLKGVANNTKVSAISPKAANAGKKVLGALLKTALTTAALGAVAAAAPVAYGAAVGAYNYSQSAGLALAGYKLAGIDSVGEAAIEGGRQVISAMLGTAYLTPTERAAVSLITGKKVH